MTDTLTRTAPAPVALPRPSRRWGWLAVLACVAAGTVGVGFGYRLAGLGHSANLYYPVFWIGMLLAVLPVGAQLLSAATSASARLAAVGLLGLVTAMPKYLRDPSLPVYHDEYAHWREALDVLQTGRLFQPNSLIPILQFFPGTSTLTAAVHRVSGLSAWSSGQLLVLAVHVLSGFAVYVLVSTHLSSGRAGGIAALVYSLNPSAIYFDTQYAYESVAIGFFLWTLTLGSLAARSQSRRSAGGYLIAALLCGLTCIVTHHLTTLALLGVLLGIAVVVAVRDRRGRTGTTPTRAWWILFGGVFLGAGLWLALVAAPTASYLSPYIGGSVSQLSGIATSGGGGGRPLLAANAQPLAERGLTALAPLVAALVCWRGLRIIRSQRARWTSATLALVAFGLVYFPSVPFVLAPAGAEGARRSWAFSYLGVALIFGLVCTTPHARPASWPGGRWLRRPRVTAGLALAALAVLLIGNVGAGLNDPYRFPGRFLWGSDTRSYTPEARTVADLLSAQTGRVRVVTDRYTALALTGFGGLDVAAPDPGFPVWELAESSRPPSDQLIGELTTSHYDYLVVDTRMYTDQAFNGNNFGASDPEGAGPVPAAALSYLDSAPWASRLLATEHLRVYRLNFDLLDTVLVGPR